MSPQGWQPGPRKPRATHPMLTVPQTTTSPSPYSENLRRGNQHNSNNCRTLFSPQKHSITDTGLRKTLSPGGVGEQRMGALKRQPPERVVTDPLVHNSLQNQRLTAAIGSLSLNLSTLNILVTVWLQTIAQRWEVSARPHQKQGLMEALIRTKLHMTHLLVLKYSKKTQL